MNFTFPEIKTNRTPDEQINQVLEEIDEYLFEIEGSPEKDKEAVDCLHSIETFIRVRFRGRENVLDELIKKTIAKNTARSYYDKECH